MAANQLSTKLDAYWFSLRLTEIDVPRSDLLIESGSNTSNLPTIIDALEQYLLVKGKTRSNTFSNGARRNIRCLTDHSGIRSLDQYRSSDAAALRDHLLEKGLQTTSLQRIFGSIKAIINFTILENGLECRNPFAGVYIPPEGGTRRLPIPTNEISVLQTECTRLDDDIRWLVALISDTGMRLSEAVGLLVEDISLETDVPHLHIRPYNHRRLKTASSTRKIPLVGCSHWAAIRIVKANADFCFPRYSDKQGCNSNSASAAINKWIKTVVNDHAVIHGLRHSFRDRLRAVQAPTDLIDQLGGWSHKTVGQNYGNGYDLDVAHNWMRQINLSRTR